MHDCYEKLSLSSMRNEVNFSGVTKTGPQNWRSRLLVAIDNQMHPHMLRDCGVTAPLLAYCGITLEYLIERPVVNKAGVVDISLAERLRYPLEHLIDALALTFDDLRLLGFRLPMLRNKFFYPLIVLYDKCAFRADTLFAYDIGMADLKNFVLDVDERYASLLRLNLPWWHSALTLHSR